MLRLGIVTDNNDPENLRRVKVQSITRGSSVSDWLSRISSFSGEDLPVPNIGDTVIIASLDSDSHTDIVLGVLTTNNTNQPLDKIENFAYQSEIGANQKLVAQRVDLQTELGKVEMSEDGGIKLSNQLGSIYLTPTGYTIISYPGGSINLGSGGLTIDSPVPVIINSPELTWNGLRLARVGGMDSRGDITIS